MPRSKFRTLHNRRRSSSMSSDDSRPSDGENTDSELEPAVLVYHESARDIVFRDHVRRAAFGRTSSNMSAESSKSGKSDQAAAPGATGENNVIIANFKPIIQPLKPLELTQLDKFKPLEESSTTDESRWTKAEQEVVRMFREERAVVKTIKNAEWTMFLRRFQEPEKRRRGFHDAHGDIPAHDENYRFNAFVTSTSLLPEMGKKMRCYGSIKEYGTGVVFALPTSWDKDSTEQTAANKSHTWCWPSGYSAKTEFNIDRHGNLINGRKEALETFDDLRKHNHAYLHDKDYKICGKVVKGGLNTIPYNEVYVRVGGLGRIVDGLDCATGADRNDDSGNNRSFGKGLGLPVALFVRSAQFGHLISLLRTRARVASILGTSHINNIPLLFITPELGVRVLTDDLEQELLKIVSRNLNPFQNPNLAYKTTIENTSEKHLEQKLEELIDLDDDNVKKVLTPKERSRLAGGFGATDDSVANLLMEAMEQDKASHEGKHRAAAEGSKLQDVVNEGLAAAVRSGDYHTSRQLLILYTLVASKGHRAKNSDMIEAEEDAYKTFNEEEFEEGEEGKIFAETDFVEHNGSPIKRHASLENLIALAENAEAEDGTLSNPIFAPPPPPPPLDTDRLRSATNSDGLLAVLGAAEVLKSMQDGSAKRRTLEAVLAIEEWVEAGEQNVAFRLASWRDQRAAQNDLKINMEDNSDFLAFVSNKATSNRKKFAQQLRELVDITDFGDLSFLTNVHQIVSKMHSPCLRLELLQYVLGLDNRYSVAHVARSVELAATCMSISAETVDADKTPVSLLTND